MYEKLIRWFYTYQFDEIGTTKKRADVASVDHLTDELKNEECN
jgi:hypothetical protein